MSYPGADICAATGKREHEVTLKIPMPDTHLLFLIYFGYLSSWEVEKKVDLSKESRAREPIYTQ